jgi:MFS transporter, AAHS family, 4-hydroxybenzoate transporter
MNSEFAKPSSTPLPNYSIVVAVCFLCNMLDGMDVLIISFTAPAIAQAWNMSPANLGIVFSSGLVGMTVGAILIAPLADRFGRKPLMAIAAFIMASCIYFTSYALGITELLIYRFISGLGIGTMMATTASITAEYSPTKTRDFWVSLVVAGYPVGAVLTGFVSAWLIKDHGWAYLYQVAGIATFVSLPIIYFLLKESPEFKMHVKPQSTRISSLFQSDMKFATIQLWLALFLSFATLYFLLNWIPKLAANSGLPLDTAIYAGTVFNIGAIVGIPVQGFCSSKFGLKKTIGWIFIVTGIFLVAFQFFAGTNFALYILFILGFGVQGGFVGLYATAARMYPTSFRTTGVGWAIGIGRLGGVTGPILGGLLVALGFGMASSFTAFSIPALAAGIVVFKITSKLVS